MGVIALLLIMVLAGCDRRAQPWQIFGRSDEPVLVNGHEPIARDDDEWPFWPAGLRIHPLTRIVTDEQTRQIFIEARVEFIDAWGDTTKCHGQMRLELTDRSGDVLSEWNIDLRDPEENRQRYDDITRTYLLKLRYDGDIWPQDALLTVYYLSVDGQRASAEFEM